MEKISDTTQRLFEELPKKSKAGSLRATIIEDFVKELNKDVGEKYKKGEKWIKIKEVKPSYIAFRLSHLKVADLYYFLSDCRQAKCSFRRAFYGGLKLK